MEESFYITTPIYYVNDRPHIGHAYTTFVCDAIARYERRKGKRVLFTTGTDENSQKNVEAMEKAGQTNLSAYLDHMADTWKQTWKDLDITFDDFIRTTEPRHIAAVTRFWNASKANGDIYLGTYEGWYCTGCERFVPETEAQNGTCPLHPNAPLKRIKEENYFFRLTKYKDELLSYYEANPTFIRPEARKNEIIQYVTNHLEDISVSRSATSLSSGIPVPDDDSQRIYVWFDALINYLTLAGFGTDDERTKAIWPANVHMVGKDIIKFHCTLWPAMILSAAGTDPILRAMKEQGNVLPKHVFAHGFFTINGMKISKSLGNAIDPRTLVPTYGLDAIRFFLMKEITFGGDGDFSEERLKERYTTDLANTLGNLVQRSVSMSRRYFSNRVPNVDLVRAGATPNGSVWDGASGIDTIERESDAHMSAFRIDCAIDAIWSFKNIKGSGIAHANKFVEETKPFQLVKSDSMKVGEILYALLESCRHYAWLVEPFMPNVSRSIITSLGQHFDIESKKSLAELRIWGGLEMGSELPEPTPIFPRLDQHIGMTGQPL